MVNRIILILFIMFLNNTFAKVNTSLLIEQSYSSRFEQVALVLHTKKVVLSLNTNQWVRGNKIGIFEITDPTIVKKIYDQIHELYYKFDIPKDTYELHQAVIKIGDKRIPPSSLNYKKTLEFVENIFKLSWIEKDVYEYIKKDNQDFIKQKSKLHKIQCKKFNSNKFCESKYGYLYL